MLVLQTLQEHFKSIETHFFYFFENFREHKPQSGSERNKQNVSAKYKTRGSEATENASAKRKAFGSEATENASAKHKVRGSEATK